MNVQEIEIASIRRFVESNREYLNGRVLDFGAGKPGTCREPQPYRDLVTGEYVPFDIGDPLPDGKFDAILCSQVIQYVEDASSLLGLFRSYLDIGGWLVLTGPTNWPIVEADDKWRFTPAGIRQLMEDNGFRVNNLEIRASVSALGMQWPLGYGVVASREA